MFQLIGVLLIALALFAARLDVASAFARGWHVALQSPLGIARVAAFIAGTARRQ